MSTDPSPEDADLPGDLVQAAIAAEIARRRRLRGFALATLVVPVLAVAAFLAWGRQDEQRIRTVEQRMSRTPAALEDRVVSIERRVPEAGRYVTERELQENYVRKDVVDREYIKKRDLERHYVSKEALDTRLKPEELKRIIGDAGRPPPEVDPKVVIDRIVANPQLREELIRGLRNR